MLSKNQEKLILSLHTKKGREKSGLCLVEGQKVIETAGDAIEYTFSQEDSPQFASLVTTETPQPLAAIANVPKWNASDIADYKTVIVLDGVQDPGNLGAIFRLCLGFHASLLLINSVDPTNPKVIRSSVGAIFHVPYLRMNQEEAMAFISTNERPIYRLEKTESAQLFSTINNDPAFLIAGSEGSGITLPLDGVSLFIQHKEELESLNVANALAIVLQNRYNT